MNLFFSAALAILITTIATATTNVRSVKVQDINRVTSMYLNKNVVIHGEIKTVLSPNAFVLDGDGLINDKIVVLRQNDEAQPSALVTDKEIQVSGKVRRMNVAEIRSEYGITLNPKVARDFDGTFPVVVAANHNIIVTEAK